MRILHSIIIKAFRDLQSPSKNNTVELVSKLCASDGIKASKATIQAELERVLCFINLCRVGRDGKKTLSRITSEIIKEGSAKKSPTVIAMDEYDSSRQENTVSIVSHPLGKDLDLLSSRPYLRISSNTLNNEDFSSVFAQVLAKDEATIFIETGGLNKGGEKRLQRILENFSSVFDCKLRIVLLSKIPNDSVFDSFVENIFGFSESSSELFMNCTPAKKPKLQNDEESRISHKEYQKTKDEEQEWRQKSKHWQKEAEKFKSEVASISEENLKLSKNLKDEVKEWQQEAHECLKQVEQFKSEAAALKEENLKLSKNLEVVRSNNGKLEDQYNEIKTRLWETEKDVIASKNSLIDASNKLKESTLRIEDLIKLKDSLESENSKAVAEMEAKDGELQNLRNILDTNNEEVKMASSPGVSVLSRNTLETEKPINLKTLISEVRAMAKVKNILVSEALQRKVKKLKLVFLYEEKSDKSVKCEVTIEGGLEKYNLPVITETGNGSSKKKARNDAVVHLLSVLGSSE